MTQDGTLTGRAFLYSQLADDALFDLGTYLEGQLGDVAFASQLRNTPDGERASAFPYTFGSTWTSSFTEVFESPGITLTTDVEQAYEVDGWGSLIVPGVEGSVPALRVKVTEARTSNGFTVTNVDYEFRTATNLRAILSETTDAPPTAGVTQTGPVMSVAAGDAPGAGRYGITMLAPNPTHSTATLSVSLPTADVTHVAVYDVLGRTVLTLADAALPAGSSTLTLDVAPLPAGTYVVRLQSGAQSWMRTLSVVR